MQNAAVDIVAQDSTIRYSTPHVQAAAGKASTQMADVVSPKQTIPDRETTPTKSPQSIQSPGVLVTEETACVQGDAGQGLTEQFDALGRAFEPDHAAGAGSASRHRDMFDHKQRSPCHHQDHLFDTEGYERSKPAAFLGSTKKRVDEADARMIGVAPELWLVPDPAPDPAVGKIFDSKRHSATRPADQMAGSCSEPTVAETEDPFMVARPAAFASNMSGDGMPHRFAASVATGTSIPGSRLGRGVYTPANHGNILSHHDSGSVSLALHRHHRRSPQPAARSLTPTPTQSPIHV